MGDWPRVSPFWAPFLKLGLGLNALGSLKSLRSQLNKVKVVKPNQSKNLQSFLEMNLVTPLASNLRSASLYLRCQHIELKKKKKNPDNINQQNPKLAALLMFFVYCGAGTASPVNVFEKKHQSEKQGGVKANTTFINYSSSTCSGEGALPPLHRVSYFKRYLSKPDALAS